MPANTNLWVIDTSSIIAVREFVPRTHQKVAYDGLTDLVTKGALTYPKQVIDELSRASNPNPSGPDMPLEWAKKNQAQATRYGTRFDLLRQILDHSQVKNVVDYEKIGVEDADPYVLELAVHLKEQGDVTVLTEDRRDRPDKLSMNTACGLLKLLCLPMELFLAQQGIWSRTG